MQRYNYRIHTSDVILRKLLHWASTFEHFVYLNSNNHSEGFPQQVAVSNRALVQGKSFTDLGKAIKKSSLPLYGHLSYDLKNDKEALRSAHVPFIAFPELSFFNAEHRISIFETHWEIESEQQLLAETILNTNIKNTSINAGSITPVLSKEEYIARVDQIREHIRRGDIFETNFCQEFRAERVIIDEVDLYLDLNKISPTPFSALYKCGEHILICASPERFIKRSGQRVTSQPIKGTAARGKNEQDDQQLLTALENSPKERAENIMIVDLVRNDLSRSCIPGTVQVEELCKVYSFPQVHQMISTISGTIAPGIGTEEILSNAFPMGSMTGAPKVRAMELTDQLEGFNRGIFSGSIGYISGDGDFDFNVVIRSIVYDRSEKKLAFHVGSAITWASSATEEFEECITKSKAIRQVLLKWGIS